jgi:hypothetical protein
MGGRLIAGNSHTSINHMYEAEVVIMKKDDRIAGKDKLHIAKNRMGTPLGERSYAEAIETVLYSRTMEQAIDILAETIARKKFRGITQIFEEGMKQELIEAIKKIVNRE